MLLSATIYLRFVLYNSDKWGNDSWTQKMVPFLSMLKVQRIINWAQWLAPPTGQPFFQGSSLDTILKGKFAPFKSSSIYQICENFLSIWTQNFLKLQKMYPQNCQNGLNFAWTCQFWAQKNNSRLNTIFPGQPRIFRAADCTATIMGIFQYQDSLNYFSFGFYTHSLSYLRPLLGLSKKGLQEHFWAVPNM